MLKLGESSLSIDRGYCQREEIGRLASATASIHWRSMEVASHYSASREYMLIIHFRGYVCRRTNKDFVYFIIQLSFWWSRIVADCTRLVSARFIPREFESHLYLHPRKYLKLWVANEFFRYF